MNTMKHITSVELWCELDSWIDSSIQAVKKQEDALGAILKFTVKKTRFKALNKTLKLAIIFGKGISNLWSYKNWLETHKYFDENKEDYSPYIMKKHQWYTLNIPGVVCETSIRGQYDLLNIILTYKNEMYTPADHELTYVKKGDMPYTSLSEFLTGVNIQKNNMSLSINLGLGYTGKYTYSKNIMSYVHHNIPAKPVFNGWKYQLGTRLMFRTNIIGKKKIYLYKKKIDYVHNIGAILGNFRSYLNTGGQLRFSLIDLPNNYGLYTNYSDNTNYQNKEQKQYYYLFVGYNLKHTFNDITMRNIDMIKNQYEYNYGIGLKRGNWSLNLIMNVESKRFKTQDSKTFGYSNINLGYLF